MNLTIGYFGIPGREGGLTHIVAEPKIGTAVPICGTPLHRSSEYQWCYPDWQMGDVECQRCKKMKQKLTAEMSKLLKRVISHAR